MVSPIPKTCIGCGDTKPLKEFYAQPGNTDGRGGRCKECVKDGVRKNYAAKRAQYAAYERERFQRPDRKEYARKALQKHRARNPEKNTARQAVANALRDGRLARGPCGVCGTTVKVQTHHADYSKPLAVEWLCFKCHREERHDQTVNNHP